MSNHDWSTYQRLVLSELDRLNKNMSAVLDMTAANKAEIEKIKFKSSVLGSVFGLLVATIFQLLNYFKSYLGGN